MLATMKHAASTSNLPQFTDNSNTSASQHHTSNITNMSHMSNMQDEGKTQSTHIGNMGHMVGNMENMGEYRGAVGNGGYGYGGYRNEMFGQSQSSQIYYDNQHQQQQQQAQMLRGNGMGMGYNDMNHLAQAMNGMNMGMNDPYSRYQTGPGGYTQNGGQYFDDMGYNGSGGPQSFSGMESVDDSGRGMNEEKVKLYKTEMCRKWETTGTCRYGSKCQFAHGQDELRYLLRHPLYKTTHCKSFVATGTCRYGSRCRFIHDETPVDLKSVPRVRVNVDRNPLNASNNTSMSLNVGPQGMVTVRDQREIQELNPRLVPEPVVEAEFVAAKTHGVSVTASVNQQHQQPAHMNHSPPQSVRFQEQIKESVYRSGGASSSLATVPVKRVPSAPASLHLFEEEMNAFSKANYHNAEWGLAGPSARLDISQSDLRLPAYSHVQQGPVRNNSSTDLHHGHLLNRPLAQGGLKKNFTYHGLDDLDNYNHVIEEEQEESFATFHSRGIVGEGKLKQMSRSYGELSALRAGSIGYEGDYDDFAAPLTSAKDMPVASTSLGRTSIGSSRNGGLSLSRTSQMSDSSHSSLRKGLAYKSRSTPGFEPDDQFLEGSYEESHQPKGNMLMGRQHEKLHFDPKQKSAADYYRTISDPDLAMQEVLNGDRH